LETGESYLLLTLFFFGRNGNRFAVIIFRRRKERNTKTGKKTQGKTKERATRSPGSKTTSRADIAGPEKTRRKKGKKNDNYGNRQRKQRATTTVADVHR
jgi:hypothetical protein